MVVQLRLSVRRVVPVHLLLLVFVVHPLLLRVKQLTLLHFVMLGVEDRRRTMHLVVEVRGLAHLVRGVVLAG